MDQTEAELESFRQKWREEVSARSRGPATAPASGSFSKSKVTASSRSQQPKALPRTAQPVHDDQDDYASPAYQDLDGKEPGYRLSDAQQDDTALSSEEPSTALEHYERAVEREGQGSLGDSLSLYRKAFRMDSNVDKKYKNKHFPPSAFRSATSASHAADASSAAPDAARQSFPSLPPTLAELISDFSSLAIVREPAPTDISEAPPCPIADLPGELITLILQYVATSDVASLARVALVCKRLAYLVMTEDAIWKQIVHGPVFGLQAMHYKFVYSIPGDPKDYSLSDEPEQTVDESPLLELPKQITLPLSTAYPTYRQMFRNRPRLRFNGCYISTVNYNRPGASAATSVTWNSPVLIVTYYRYLRFFRDGSVISLLTTSEPAEVVPHLQLEHVHNNHTGAFPQSVMKDALIGRWRLTGDPWKVQVKQDQEAEPEGDVVIETEGVVPKYMYKMHLALASAGKGTRNNKLAWRGHWSWNRLTDDWAEFAMKNYRAFYWSRVRSFGTGL